MKKLIALLVFFYASSSWSQSCGAITDFEESFSTAVAPALPACWSQILDNGATQYASINTTEWMNFTAPTGVEMYNDNSAAASNIILVSPMVSNLSAGTHWFRFYASNSTSSQDLEVGTVSDPTDGSTFTPLETVDVTLEWNEFSVDFTNYTGTDEYIAIRRLSTAIYTYVYLDDMVWEEKPFCLPPSNITITNLGSDSFTINWDAFENASGGYEYIVVFEGIDPDGATPLAAGTTSNTSVDVTGLSPATNYSVHVRSNCGDSEGGSTWSHAESVLTSCVWITDFNESFDAVTMPDLPTCWGKALDDSTSAYANVNTTQWNSFSAPNGVELYNADSPASSSLILVAPWVSNLNSGTHWLHFKGRNGESTQDIEIGTMTDPNDSSTFSVWETRDLNATWQEFYVDFSGYTGTDEFIAFRRINTVMYTAVFLDDIVWEEKPACVFPTDLAVNATTLTGATIAWDEMGTTPSNGFSWVVVTENGDPDVASDIITSGTSSIAEATVSGLSSGTTYHFYVQADCGTDGMSLWSEGESFTTAYGCGNDFYDTGGQSGNYQENEVQTWTIMPDTPNEYVQIDFTMVDVELNYDYLRVFDGADENAPQLSNATTGVIAPGIYTSSTAGEPLTITFNSDYTANFPGWEATISCVVCVAPASVNISNLTSDSVTLSWTNVPEASSFDYAIVLEGEDPEDLNTVPVASGNSTTTTQDITALDPATDYDVYVMSNCGTNGTSIWSNVESFLTLCVPVTEFSENFDGVANPELPVCWGRILDNGADEWATINTISWDSQSAPNSIDFYSSGSPSTANLILVAPMVSNLDAGTHWLRFYARNISETQDLEVGTISDPSDGSTFTVLETVDIGLDWEEYTVNFSSYTGTDQYIAIRRIATEVYTNVYMDNIVWEQIPSCIAPDDLEIVEVFEDSVSVLWEGPDNADDYEYVIVEAGGDPEDDTQVVVSGISATNEYVIDGLLSGVDYQLYVISNCGVEDGSSILSHPIAFTTACQSPTGLSVIDVGGEEMEFGWDVALQSLGYEYVVVISGMPVTPDNYIAVGTIGSASQDSIIVEDLDPGQEYDLYFRIVCDNNFVGGWTNVPFQTLGVEKNYIEGFTFYPNPVKDELKLQAKSNIEKVEVINMLGQIIKEKAPNMLNYTLYMDHLTAGTYFIKVTVGGQTGNYKILKD